MYFLYFQTHYKFRSDLKAGLGKYSDKSVKNCTELKNVFILIVQFSYKDIICKSRL